MAENKMSIKDMSLIDKAESHLKKRKKEINNG